MTFRPFVQLRTGSVPLTIIPPERLRSLVYTSSLSVMSSFQVSMIDPTYHEIEDLLLLAGSNADITYMRFGYVIPGGATVVRGWARGYLVNYTPRISNRGMEITANFEVMPSEALTEVRPSQYAGRISKVVSDVATKLGMNCEVEETNDDYNEAHADYDNGPRQWFTGNLTPIRFIRDKLLDEARSKTSKGAYTLFVTHADDEQATPTLHFHTRNFKSCSRGNSGDIDVTYFASHDNSEVLEFEPSYDSKGLGAYGIGSMVTRSFDEGDGQNKVKVENSLVTESDSAFDSSNKTVAPISETNPESPSVSHGIVADKGAAEEVEARSLSRWDVLHASSYTASISLVGLPKFVNLEAFDFMNVGVLVPYQGGFREHWSSGRWIVTEAVHTIESGYTIQAQLERAYSKEGSLEA